MVQVIGQPTTSAERFYNAYAAEYGDALQEREPYLRSIEELTLGALHQADGECILDVGCGNGVRTAHISDRLPSAQIVGIDISSEMVSAARSIGVSAYKVDIADESGEFVREHATSFDAALCLWNVLGHIPGTEGRVAALRNINQLLRPSAKLILDVNNRHNAAAYGPRNVLRNMARGMIIGDEAGDVVARRTTSDGEVATVGHLFSTSELHRLLKAGGFKPEQTNYFNYQTGERKSSRFLGQISVVATKKT